MKLHNSSTYCPPFVLLSPRKYKEQQRAWLLLCISNRKYNTPQAGSFVGMSGKANSFNSSLSVNSSPCLSRLNSNPCLSRLKMSPSPCFLFESILSSKCCLYIAQEGQGRGAVATKIRNIRGGGGGGSEGAAAVRKKGQERRGGSRSNLLSAGPSNPVNFHQMKRL